jgi:hypothetical protein
MVPSPHTPNRLAFGPFEVNVSAGELFKHGVRVRLSGSRLVAREGRDPKFSPDGSQIAYWVGSPGVHASVPGAGAVRLVTPLGGQPKQLAQDLTHARNPIWSPDGKHLLVIGTSSAKAYDTSATDWWLLDIHGGPSVKLGIYEGLVREGLQGDASGRAACGSRSDTAFRAPARRLRFESLRCGPFSPSERRRCPRRGRRVPLALFEPDPTPRFDPFVARVARVRVPAGSRNRALVARRWTRVPAGHAAACRVLVNATVSGGS